MVSDTVYMNRGTNAGMVRKIAYYLPQFHQIPENDSWWGEGFTEWFNVRRARPQFDGHLHPRVAGAMGEYDLTDTNVLRTQSDLARQYGVDAFCAYFYWFDGARLLERPIDLWRQDPSLLPYCLSWANEHWSRRWDGKSRDVLMHQRYNSGFEDGLFADLLPHLTAPHYLRQNGMPVLLVHRADLIPDPNSSAERLRQLAMEAGLPGLHLVASETTPDLRPQSMGFDAVAEFPPVGANTLRNSHLRPVRGLNADFRGRLMSYDRLAAHYQRRQEPTFIRYRGATPAWDNTARRQSNATIYVGSTPAKYAAWLKKAQTSEASIRGDEGLVFINAWNEWAEGAYLEPDQHHSHEYLRATQHPESNHRGEAIGGVKTGKMWTYAQLRSMLLAAAGSLLALKRRFRNRMR